MFNFRIQRDVEVVRGAYFPEPVQHTRRDFQVTRCSTMGHWKVRRLIVGDLNTVRRLVARAVSEYDFTRMKHPEITSLRLYEQMPQLLDTHLEEWDYSGSVQSISRESVMMLYNHGQLRALERNLSVGFGYIIRKARTPWSQDAWIQQEFKKAIARSIAFQTQIIATPIGQVREVIAAQEARLVTEQQLAFNRLYTTYTPENYAAALDAWEKLLMHREATSIALYMSSDPDTVVPRQLPSLQQVQEMWEQYYLSGFRYEDYAPYLDHNLDPPNRRVTLCRGAALTDSRMMITINTAPTIATVSLQSGGQLLNSTLQYMTYASPPQFGVNIALAPRGQVRANYRSRPTHYEPHPSIRGWNGQAPMPPGWTVFTSKETPEPQLVLYPKVRIVAREPASLMRAVNWPKPTLIAGTPKPNKALPLVFPDMMVSVDITPAVTNYHLLEPLDPNYKVQGQAVAHDGRNQVISPSVNGFIIKPITGRPSRTGILPDLFGT